MPIRGPQLGDDASVVRDFGGHAIAVGQGEQLHLGSIRQLAPILFFECAHGFGSDKTIKEPKAQRQKNPL